MLIPSVVEKTHNWERSYDIYSRLLEDRIIFVGTQIDDQVANVVVAQLLYLTKVDPTKDITMYINSPGWEIVSGMAVYDTMQFIQPDVVTVCVGMAASMGSMLLMWWTKGKRYSLPHGEILIHQPLGGAQWQATQIEIVAKNILKRRERLNLLIVHHTGQSLDRVYRDTDRDNFMTATEALEYGIIDRIIWQESELSLSPVIPKKIKTK